MQELERQNIELSQTLHLIEEARSHYADHYDFAPFGCLTLDVHGCIGELNLAAARMLGFARARLIGKPLFPLVESGSLPIFLAHLRACNRSRERVVNEIVVGRGGRPKRIVEFSSVPVIDPRTERTGFRTVLVDVTERRRAEDELRQSEERFSKAFRAGPGAAAICARSDGRFIDVNAVFCKLTGYARPEVIGRTPEELGLRPDNAARSKLWEQLRKERRILNHEGRVRMKSGVLRNVLLSAEVIWLDGEECVLVIGQDVTELKRLQREVLEISEREKRRIGQDLHDDACQSLAGIAMLAEVVARELAPENPGRAVEVGEIARMLKENIHRVSRLAAGLFPVKIERYGLAWALEELVIETSRRWGVQSTFAMPEPIEIRDENVSMHLYRIAQEACSNAARHGRARRIDVELTSDGERVKLTIRDDGCGIRRKPKHDGLGLHSMEYRASLIGGTLDIDRAAKRGTVVATIFLVEDHQMVRECLKLYIAQEGDLEVIGEASTAKEALIGIEQREPDVVIFDLSLPGMNGLEFFKNLKTRYPKIAGVVLSMHDEAIYAERALRAGALGYVMKKESTDQLTLAIRKAIKGEYFVSTHVTGAIFNKALGALGPGKITTESPVALLSDRELEVFEKIGHGMSTRDISAALNLSPKTVEAHRLHIKEKLRLQTAAELIRYALRWMEYETTGSEIARFATPPATAPALAEEGTTA